MDNHCNGESGGILNVLKTRMKEINEEYERLQILDEQKEEDIKREKEDLDYLEQDRHSLTNREKLLSSEYSSMKQRLDDVLQKQAVTEARLDTSERRRQELEDGDEERSERIQILETQRKEILEELDFTQEKISDGQRSLKLLEEARRKVQIKQDFEDAKRSRLNDDINSIRERITKVTLYGSQRDQVDEDAERKIKDMTKRIKIAKQRKEEADHMSLQCQMQSDRSISNMMKYQMRIQSINEELHRKPSQSHRPSQRHRHHRH